MTINSLLIGAIIAVAVGALFVFAGVRWRTGSHDKREELETLRRSRHYWGVKIQPGQCKVIRPFAGPRFSFEEAPALPLADCTAKHCSCRYVGVTERRREERRAKMDRRRALRIEDEHADRRSLRGRRRN